MYFLVEHFLFLPQVNNSNNNNNNNNNNVISPLLHVMLHLLGTANVPSSLTLFILLMETMRSSETSVLTRTTRRHIPEDGILHSDSRENLKSYIALTSWAM
jgi:hypothetical protein